MEVLNAAGIAPVSSLQRPPSISSSDRRLSEPKKLFSLKFPRLPNTPDAQKTNLADFLTRGFTGGLAVLSSVVTGAGLAKALTYEEALQQSVESSSESPGFDAGDFVDGIIKFGTENPLIIGGGAVVLAVPLILSQVLGKPKPYGVESVKNSYARLSEDAAAQLLDIREGKDFREVGSPDVRGIKKKAVSIAYIREDKPGFLNKLSLKFKDPGNTTLFILDKFDGNSEMVAELVTANGFKAAYAIKDGAEGPRGWKNSGLPWSPPKKTLQVDFGDLKDVLSGALGEGTEGLPVSLGLAAALGVLAFSEIETVLQLLGSAAVVQFAAKKLLFAEDRKATLKQVDEFLNTKVAPKELVDEIKMIGKALLPVSTNVKASLPAPVEESKETPPVLTLEKVDDRVTNVPPAVEAAAEPPKEFNLVPKEEIKSESLNGRPRPLSPYPYYEDFKPPTSPSPSQP